jgi:hypothetical protein
LLEAMEIAVKNEIETAFDEKPKRELVGVHGVIVMHRV